MGKMPTYVPVREQGNAEGSPLVIDGKREDFSDSKAGAVFVAHVAAHIPHDAQLLRRLI